ncbi:MAG: regulatory protein RecX [Candidatus Omnitrophota bacterium]
MRRKYARSLASASRPQVNNPEKAREYAFLLLKYRLRSEQELLQRLKLKGFSEELCRDTLNFLKDREFIDDRIFARGWVASRLKRPFGLRRIKQELIQKGLDKEVIEDTLSRYRGQSQKSGQSPLEEDYDEGSILRRLAEQRFSKLKGVEPLKARQRVYAYLMRRGFSPDLINSVVNK